MAKGEKTLGLNRKARHEYFIDEIFEAGMELKGTEVKSMRMGRSTFKDSYVSIRNGEAYLISMHVAPYEKGNIFNVDSERDRKLLLHKKQIRYLNDLSMQQGVALVPLRLYLKSGRVKLEFAVAKGKKFYDKRATKADQTAKRQIERAFADRNK
ncbi:MAG: SsrA-binding protein SmpB [Clostridiales bacterium]|nr:SsrA-binding protein SmpB [Clostridiales bacterium]